MGFAGGGSVAGYTTSTMKVSYHCENFSANNRRKDRFWPPHRGEKGL